MENENHLLNLKWLCHDSYVPEQVHVIEYPQKENPEVHTLSLVDVGADLMHMIFCQAS